MVWTILGLIHRKVLGKYKYTLEITRWLLSCKLHLSPWKHWVYVIPLQLSVCVRKLLAAAELGTMLRLLFLCSLGCHPLVLILLHPGTANSPITGAEDLNFSSLQQPTYADSAVPLPPFHCPSPHGAAMLMLFPDLTSLWDHPLTLTMLVWHSCPWHMFPAAQ